MSQRRARPVCMCGCRAGLGLVGLNLELTENVSASAPDPFEDHPPTPRPKAEEPARGSAATRPQTSREEERRLVQRVRDGDVAAFDQLVRRYFDRAGAIARRLMQNREDAEDLVQDAFMRALERLDSFDDSRDFGPWFFRLLVNTGINSRRSRTRRQMEPEPFEAPSFEALPDELAERSEIRDRFEAALAALPERQRMIIGMFEVDGFSSVEIAETLGVSPETVRWHVHQARQALRRALSPVKE